MAGMVRCEQDVLGFFALSMEEAPPKIPLKDNRLGTTDFASLISFGKTVDSLTIRTFSGLITWRPFHDAHVHPAGADVLLLVHLLESRSFFSFHVGSSSKAWQNQMWNTLVECNSHSQPTPRLKQFMGSYKDAVQQSCYFRVLAFCFGIVVSFL